MSWPPNASRPAAAATQTSAMTISAGRNRTPYILVSAMALSLGPDSIVRYVAHLSCHLRSGRLQEFRAFQQRAQAEHRPALGAASECARQVTLAACDRRRRRTGELAFVEAAEPEHLVDQQAGGHFAVMRDQHARRAVGVGGTAAEERAQVDHRQQLTAHVGDPANPGLRAGHARHHRGQAEYFARLFARDQKTFRADAERDADPLALAARVAALAGRRNTRQPLELDEQLEGFVAQGFESGARRHREFSPGRLQPARAACAVSISFSIDTGFTR